MMLAHAHSRELLANDGPYRQNNYEKPFDFTLETFVMLAVENGEWASKEMTEREFIKCIRGIFSTTHPRLSDLHGPEFVKWFMIAASATQFYLQGNERYRIKRYYDYFTFQNESINMPEELQKVFGLTYEKIAGPAIALWALENPDYDYRDLAGVNVLYWLKNQYPETVKLLTYSREEYQNELHRFTGDPLDYLYCVRPSYSRPFIEYNGCLYNPTPHLLIRAVTVSLMHRLTQGNDDLRARIGKHVLEPYLFKLVKECGLFSEVLGEQQYGADQKTLDVLACTDSDIVCFESKSFSAVASLRVVDFGVYEKEVKRIAKGVSQVYRQIYNHFGRSYSFLHTELKEDRSNIFGILVLADNPHIRLQDIYEKAAEDLSIDVDSDEYSWLCGHVGVVDLDILEHQLVDCDNFSEALRYNLNSGHINDNWFMPSPTRKDYKFPEAVTETINAILREIV